MRAHTHNHQFKYIYKYIHSPISILFLPTNSSFLHTHTLNMHCLSLLTNTYKVHSLKHTQTNKFNFFFNILSWISIFLYTYNQRSIVVLPLSLSLFVLHIDKHKIIWCIETMRAEANVIETNRKLKDIGSCWSWGVEQNNNNNS